MKIFKDKCEFFGCGNNINMENDHFFIHYKDSKKSDIHCIFINVNTYKIICIDCNQEIYDIETLKTKNNRVFTIF